MTNPITGDITALNLLTFDEMVWNTGWLSSWSVSQLVTEVSSQNVGYQSVSQVVVEVAYTIKPTVISFSPSEGSVGIEVTITGSNFSEPAIVTFNGTVAVINTFSPAELVVTVPVGATTGKISVDGVLSSTDFTVLTIVRYWVGNTGYWNDTAHWSTTSGGVGGASVPIVGTDMYIDNNSFTEPGHHIEFE